MFHTAAILYVIQSHRRLARITPHGPDACIDSGTLILHYSFYPTSNPFPSSLFLGLASGYLNRPEVMEAIHVRDPGFCWAVCNTAPGWKYTVSALLCCNCNSTVYLLYYHCYRAVTEHPYQPAR